MGTVTSIKPLGRTDTTDRFLAARARAGDLEAVEVLMGRYRNFVRFKATSYFLTGGEPSDLIQEGMIGLHKAIRDFRPDRESSFRNFAELCISRQIITAVKTSTRNKHQPLNQYVSFASTPASVQDGDPTLDEVLPGSSIHNPANQVISSEELSSLVTYLSTGLSEFEARVLSVYIDGCSYEQIAAELECEWKAVDNALQRIKRKVARHLATRCVLDAA
jgi:RNA polymerase sporulation-specific sigma factor